MIVLFWAQVSVVYTVEYDRENGNVDCVHGRRECEGVNLVENVLK